MTTHEANQRLAGDLRVLMRDAEELLKATASETGEKMREMRGRLTAVLESAKVTCARLQDRTVEAVKATDHVIREHPYQSIGIAFGIGVLVGVLVARLRPRPI